MAGKTNNNSVIEKYGQSFSAIEKSLEKMFEGLLRNYDQPLTFLEPWMKDWVAGMKQIDNSVRKFQYDNKFLEPDGYQRYRSFNKELGQRLAMYDSYIHMTNNRLGVSNTDEGYIAYIIQCIGSQVYMII